MPGEENKALVRRAYELLSKKDWTAIRQIMAANFVDHNPLQGQKPGVEGFLESRISFWDAFVDPKFIIEDTVAEGDKVAVRFTASATHRGELLGLAPTNKRVSYTETTIWRVSKGKCVERWSNSDTLSLLQQLGGVTVNVPPLAKA
jgi:predicted ester cyclase